MLIHRYANEFTDTGNRATLPTVEMGVGLAGYDRRWRSSSIALADGSPVAAWTDSISGMTVSASGSKQPLVKTVSGIKVLEFDGVDDELAGPVFGAGYSAVTNPKTITYLFRVRAQAASSAKGIANVGGGALEVDTTSSQVRARTWFNGSGSGGGGTGSQGNNVNPASIADAKFAVVSVVGTHDGLHELTVGKTHSVLAGTPALMNGMNAMVVGRSGSTSFAQMDMVETITWPAELTRVEREKVDTGLRLNYPSLAFIA